MHYDLGSILSQVQGNGATNAGRGTGDERFLTLEVVLLSDRHIGSFS
jgi:hypothetical protein